MALPHLTDEQIATWTRAQKDEWWFKNVFRGDMAQLTLRSGFTGFLLGGILSTSGSDESAAGRPRATAPATTSTTAAAPGRRRTCSSPAR